MNEFDIIAKYFVPLTMGRVGSAGLKDDGAVVSVPAGHELVVTSDTLNEGVHFLEGEHPANIAHKALRVNLSDLAAMGADTLCYQLNLAFPEKPSPEWLEAFTGALLEDQKAYGIYCSGGDTTTIKGGYLSVSITAMGSVPLGKAVRRGGARDGDVVILSGAVGDAVLGLRVLQGGLDSGVYSGAVERYRRPQPRNVCAGILREYAHACADVSDGLLADVGHIGAASGLGVKLDVSAMELSAEVQKAMAAGIITLEDVLSGGDDYELVMAVAPEKGDEFMFLLRKVGLFPVKIGFFLPSVDGVNVCNGAIPIEIGRRGWSHF